MNINTNDRVSITEANQNFSKIARLVDEKGTAVITRNEVPRYIVMEYSAMGQEQVAADEDVLSVSKPLMEKNHQAYGKKAEIGGLPPIPDTPATVIYIEWQIKNYAAQ